MILKIKDLSVSNMMTLKYLVCRFIMSQFEDDEFLDDIISEKTKERLAEKHSIKDADKKDLDLVVYQITQGHTKEEKESLMSATYDYVVNSMFSLENADANDGNEQFPESLIVKPKNHVIAAKLKSKFGTITMKVMEEDHYKQITTCDDVKFQASMTATEKSSGNGYAILIV
jgi:hypothetical protein